MTLVKRLEDAIEHHRIMCCALTVRAMDRETKGEGIREGLAKADADLRDTIIAALSEGEMGWRPIKTAPKDGTHFLATHVKSGVQRITWYGKTSHIALYGWCEGEDAEDIDLWEPTHWMPLPKAPAFPSVKEHGNVE